MILKKRVVLASTKLGRYNRTTVPNEVRKLLGLNEGDEVLWILEDDKIIIEKGGSDAQKEKTK
ncbi:MAG: AbrB/MazE/SpoVT family DNA-binding domain-containing protein [Desulfurococcales archaeon]|nr:AbrB/MazE/SpoVT family DNA-binding domain-containing protein [Desulfurococcales archaeon]